MERLKGTLPSNIDMQLAFDATKFMENAISEITKTLFETILIVGVVVFLFMGSLRTAIVPLIAMPVSLIGAILIMRMMDFSLNLLTLLAIVLSVGLVVDDAIVVVENIQRHVLEGKRRIEAALLGARELVGPIIAMTITLATVRSDRYPERTNWDALQRVCLYPGFGSPCFRDCGGNFIADYERLHDQARG